MLSPSANIIGIAIAKSSVWMDLWTPITPAINSTIAIALTYRWVMGCIVLHQVGTFTLAIGLTIVITMQEMVYAIVQNRNSCIAGVTELLPIIYCR